ncbi:hypothetical protein WEU38_11035 [Cyanobacterium aponinum AL20118]|uniref:Uncharacterized protein n=1 Tax=Cyanobacterium aponinum AL20115 TaxID=3090662 RepID=A0AAF0Z6Z4_9CHRO|nr:hypothetical protein [Cyanobacterium aponinum]WPF87346.1 hypothetical protein SAY89_11065 [Cyanobacterium aponinum AL20115]
MVNASSKGTGNNDKESIAFFLPPTAPPCCCRCFTGEERKRLMLVYRSIDCFSPPHGLMVLEKEKIIVVMVVGHIGGESERLVIPPCRTV